MESNQTPPPLPPQPPPRPSPVEPLDYFRQAPPAPASWAVATRCRSVAQWHSLKKSLASANIQSLMGSTSPEQEVELLVRESDLPRADLIIKAFQMGLTWCPRCGSTAVKKVPLPWRWKLLDILLLGMLPYMPPRYHCQSCPHKWG